MADQVDGLGVKLALPRVRHARKLDVLLTHAPAFRFAPASDSARVVNAIPWRMIDL